MSKTRNEMTVHLKLKRSELCDLLLACLATCNGDSNAGKKWINLHQKLQKQLDDFDSELDEYRSFMMRGIS